MESRIPKSSVKSHETFITSILIHCSDHLHPAWNIDCFQPKLIIMNVHKQNSFFPLLGIYKTSHRKNLKFLTRDWFWVLFTFTKSAMAFIYIKKFKEHIEFKIECVILNIKRKYALISRTKKSLFLDECIQNWAVL